MIRIGSLNLHQHVLSNPVRHLISLKTHGSLPLGSQKCPTCPASWGIPLTSWEGYDLASTFGKHRRGSTSCTIALVDAGSTRPGRLVSKPNTLEVSQCESLLARKLLLFDLHNYQPWVYRYSSLPIWKGGFWRIPRRRDGSPPKTTFVSLYMSPTQGEGLLNSNKEGVQGGPLPVISGVITPLIGVITPVTTL